MTPDGQFKFNAPHSHGDGPLDVPCPWSFQFMPQTDIVRIKMKPQAFSATGFMACPMLNTSRTDDTEQQWQIYANSPSAKVYYGWEQKNSSW